MTTPRKPARTKPAEADVQGFMDTLNHPMKAEVEAVRSIILAADSTITEGVKWHAPSFRTTDYFATIHLRTTTAVQVILHFGAKVKPDMATGAAISDPQTLLTWLATDRATVKFPTMAAITAQSTAFQDLIRQWIARMP